MAKESIFTSELKSGVNQYVAEDSSVTLTRNVLVKEDKTSRTYDRQYVKWFNLPVENGLHRRALIEGLKIVTKAAYGTDKDWNEIGVLDWNVDAEKIESKLVDRVRTGGGSAEYQAELKEELSSFDAYCDSRAQEKGKGVAVYRVYKAALRSKAKVLQLGPKALDNLRKLWSAYVEETYGDNDESYPATVVNTTNLVHFDAIDVDDDDI